MTLGAAVTIRGTALVIPYVALHPSPRDTHPVATLDTLLSTLPESPLERGRAFERLSKWYLENNPTDSMRRVWLWDDWPSPLVKWSKREQRAESIRCRDRGQAHVV